MKTSASVSVQYASGFSPFLPERFPEALEWAAGCGFDGVELIVLAPRLLDVKSIRAQVAERDLAVSAISTGLAAWLEGLSMTSISPRIRRATRKRLCEDMDFAAELGGARVTIGSIRGAGGEKPARDELKLLQQELSFLADCARERGIVLNLEPINRYETSLLNTTDSALALLDEMGNPDAVGILYDTFHSNIEDVDMIEAIRTCGGRLSHVHLADSNRRLPGEGHVDFARIIAALREIGYDGFVSLETLCAPSPEHVIAHAKGRIAVLV